MPSLEAVLLRVAEITTIGNYPLFLFKKQYQILYKKKTQKSFEIKVIIFFTCSCNDIYLEQRYL